LRKSNLPVGLAAFLMIHEYKTNEPLNYIVIAFLALQCLLYGLSILVGVAQIATPDLTVDVDEGSALSVWMGIQSLIILGRFGIYVLTIIVFLIWIYRAHRNLYALRPTYLRFSPGWAVGWWFVPFANLVRPFQVMREIWWESDPDIPQEQMFLTESLHGAPTYMGIWWALWLTGNLLSNILNNVFDPEDVRTTEISGYLFVFAGLLTMAAALFLIYGVYDISRRQSLRFERILAEFNDTPRS
jgi:hypothetical protein